MTGTKKWMIACAALAIGEAVGFAMPSLGPTWPLAAALAAFVALSCVAFASRALFFCAVSLLGVALALAASYSRRQALDDMLELCRGKPVCAVYEIPDAVAVTPRGDGSVGVSFASDVRGVGVQIRMTLRAGDTIPSPGERWSVAGWLERGDGRLFGRRRALWVRGAGSHAHRVAAVEPRSWRAVLRAVRADFSRRAGIGLGEQSETAMLNRAILLGERANMPRDMRETFAAAGTMHVFAISGLHVLILARLLFTVILLARVPLRMAAVVAIPVLWAYVALVGAGPSAVRAASMASFQLGAIVFCRKPNGIVSWAATFFATCLLSPTSLCNVGCLLSFAVMLAIVAWTQTRFARSGTLCGNASVAAVAWAAGVPIVARVFGRFTPGGLVANLFIIPAAAVSVVCGALGIAVSFVSESLAAYLNSLAALSTNVMTGISCIFAALPFAGTVVEPWGLGTCALWYAALAAVYFVVRRLEASRPQWW